MVGIQVTGRLLPQLSIWADLSFLNFTVDDITILEEGKRNKHKRKRRSSSKKSSRRSSHAHCLHWTRGLKNTQRRQNRDDDDHQECPRCDCGNKKIQKCDGNCQRQNRGQLQQRKQSEDNCNSSRQLVRSQDQHRYPDQRQRSPVRRSLDQRRKSPDQRRRSLVRRSLDQCRRSSVWSSIDQCRRSPDRRSPDQCRRPPFRRSPDHCRRSLVRNSPDQRRRSRDALGRSRDDYKRSHGRSERRHDHSKRSHSRLGRTHSWSERSFNRPEKSYGKSERAYGLSERSKAIPESEFEFDRCLAIKKREEYFRRLQQQRYYAMNRNRRLTPEYKQQSIGLSYDFGNNERYIGCEHQNVNTENQISNNQNLPRGITLMCSSEPVGNQTRITLNERFTRLRDMRNQRLS